MIIICKKCKTHYNLDDSQLEPEGSKVRCSICKNIFIAHPAQPPKKSTVDPTNLKQEQDSQVPVPTQKAADSPDKKESNKIITNENIDALLNDLESDLDVQDNTKDDEHSIEDIDSTIEFEIDEDSQKNDASEQKIEEVADDLYLRI